MKDFLKIFMLVKNSFLKSTIQHNYEKNIFLTFQRLFLEFCFANRNCSETFQFLVSDQQFHEK